MPCNEHDICDTDFQIIKGHVNNEQSQVKYFAQQDTYYILQVMNFHGKMWMPTDGRLG